MQSRVDNNLSIVLRKAHQGQELAVKTITEIKRPSNRGLEFVVAKLNGKRLLRSIQGIYQRSSL